MAFHPLAHAALAGSEASISSPADFSAYDSFSGSPRELVEVHRSPQLKQGARSRPYALIQPSQSTAASLRSVEPPTDYLLIVVPSAKMGMLLSRLGQQGLERGTLINLFPSLHGQLAAIARQLHLPTASGMLLYINEVYSLSPADSSFKQASGPRISDETWPILWASKLEVPDMTEVGLAGDDFDMPPVPPIPSSFLAGRQPEDFSGDESSFFAGDPRYPAPAPQSGASNASSRTKRSPATRSSSAASTRHPHSVYFGSGSHGNRSTSSLSSHAVMKPPSAGVIAGKVELDIDARGERWLDEWVTRRVKSESRTAPDVFSPLFAHSTDEVASSAGRDAEDAVHADTGETAVGREDRSEDMLLERAASLASSAHEKHLMAAGYAPLDGDENDHAGPQGDPLADVFGRDEMHWGQSRPREEAQDVMSDAAANGAPTPELQRRSSTIQDVAEVSEMLREHRPKELSLSSPVPVPSPRFHSEFVASLEQTPAGGVEQPECGSMPSPVVNGIETQTNEAADEPAEPDSRSASNVNELNWAETVANTFGTFALRRKPSLSSSISEGPQMKDDIERNSGTSHRSSILLQQTLDEADAALADLATQIKSPSPPSSDRLIGPATLRGVQLQKSLGSAPPSPSPLSPPSARSSMTASPGPTNADSFSSRNGYHQDAGRPVVTNTRIASRARPDARGKASVANREAADPAPTTSPARTSSLAATQSPLLLSSSSSSVPQLPVSPSLAQHATMAAAQVLADEGEAPGIASSPALPSVEMAIGSSHSSEISPKPFHSPLFSSFSERPDSAATSKTSLAYLGGSPPSVSGCPAESLPTSSAEVIASITPVDEHKTPYSREADRTMMLMDSQRAPAAREPASSSIKNSSLRLTKPFAGRKATSPSQSEVDEGAGAALTPTKQSFNFKNFFGNGKKDSEAKPAVTTQSISSPMLTSGSPRGLFGTDALFIRPAHYDHDKAAVDSSRSSPEPLASPGRAPLATPLRRGRSDAKTSPSANQQSSFRSLRQQSPGGVAEDLDHIMAQLVVLQREPRRPEESSHEEVMDKGTVAAPFAFHQTVPSPPPRLSSRPREEDDDDAQSTYSEPDRGEANLL